MTLLKVFVISILGSFRAGLGADGTGTLHQVPGQEWGRIHGHGRGQIACCGVPVTLIILFKGAGLGT